MKKLYFTLLVLIFTLGGCYTQMALSDTPYGESYDYYSSYDEMEPQESVAYVDYSEYEESDTLRYVDSGIEYEGEGDLTVINNYYDYDQYRPYYRRYYWDYYPAFSFTFGYNSYWDYWSYNWWCYPGYGYYPFYYPYYWNPWYYGGYYAYYPYPYYYGNYNYPYYKYRTNYYASRLRNNDGGRGYGSRNGGGGDRGNYTGGGGVTRTGGDIATLDRSRDADLDNEIRRGTAAIGDGRVDTRNGDLGIPTRTNVRNREAAADNEGKGAVKRQVKPSADGAVKTKRSIDQIDVNKTPRKTYAIGNSDNSRIKTKVPTRLQSKKPVYKTKRPSGYNRSGSKNSGTPKSYGNNGSRSYSKPKSSEPSRSYSSPSRSNNSRPSYTPRSSNSGSRPTGSSRSSSSGSRSSGSRGKR